MFNMRGRRFSLLPRRIYARKTSRPKLMRRMQIVVFSGSPGWRGRDICRVDDIDYLTEIDPIILNGRA